MSKLGKKVLKVSGIFIGSLLVLLVAFHFWFIYHAKDMLEQLVEKKSHGKLKLKVEKLRYDYFSRTMKITQASFFSTDTATATNAYRFNVSEIKVKLTALLPFVFEKKLLIDSLNLQSPDIRVTILRRSSDSLNTPDREQEDARNTSIPYQMGNIYKSIQQVLRELQVKRFQILNGEFTLDNKADPTQTPLVIGNIDFHIDNLNVTGGELTGHEKLLFSDNIVLRSHNQDIVFPDGRHLLSFEKFRINLASKLVEFDSCIISGARADSGTSSFSVFFDKLLLSNIDFDTLYRAEVIKADTVFCQNPKFTLRVDISKKRDSTAKGPSLEKIIQQLTGDLLLANVIVTNASFDISTVRNGAPSSFTSHGNNFDMQGLVINQSSPKPISVKGFAMAIRNYENFIRDSSYSVRFDSVLFKDDRIYLSNFVFHKQDRGRIINTFNIPQFYLGGLSWDDLVFEKRLKAGQATLFDPYINYTVSHRKKKKGSQQLFQSLESISDIMDIQYLDIVNGELDLKVRKNVNLHLKNATLSIESRALLNATELSGIKKSVNYLDFDKGTIRANNLTIDMQGIKYKGENGQFAAGVLKVKDNTKKLSITARNAKVASMQVDERSGDILANGIRWGSADINIQGSPGSSGNKNDESIILLNDIQGTNTRFTGKNGNGHFAVQLDHVTLSSLEKTPGTPVQLHGLVLNGKQLTAGNTTSDLKIDRFTIADNGRSVFTNIAYRKQSAENATIIHVPVMSAVPDIQSLISRRVNLQEVKMERPFISILSHKDSSTPSASSPLLLPKMSLQQLELVQPQVLFTQVNNNTDTTSVSWDGHLHKGNRIYLDAVTASDSTGIAMKNFALTAAGFEYKKTGGRKFGSGEGTISALFDRVSLQQENGVWNWTVSVDKLQGNKLLLDKVGARNGRLQLDSFTFNRISASSSLISKLDRFIRENEVLSWQNVTGHYVDSFKTIRWYNAGFDKSHKKFSLDSFSVRPNMSRDSFMAKQTYQKDYLDFKSGAITIHDFDADAFYSPGNVIRMRSVHVANAVLDDYRDKRLPHEPNRIKPLPVDAIKKIATKISIDTIEFSNGTVYYSEFNEKTNMAGTIPITRMSVKAFPIRNYDLTATDSLRLHATGYLMDTMWTRLRVNESYLDTLSGFIMTLRMKPADLKLLNPVLVPLASAELKSGFLDTLSMRAAGSEYLSFGEMRMYYHDLKVRYLKNGDQLKRTFFTKLVTFIANSVVRNKNTSRTGRVFFVRMRDRSILQFLVKMTMSGAASSVGAKSNRKALRKYHRELHQRQLPPFELE